MSPICHTCTSFCDDNSSHCQPCQAKAKTALEEHRDAPTCFDCKASFTAKTLISHGGFCGRCIKYRNTTDEPHNNITRVIAEFVWLRHYYPARQLDQKCYCCGLHDINAFNFQCGHVVAQSRGGPTTIENLRPICSPCNQGMGNTDMREFVAKYALIQGALWREIQAANLAVAFDGLKIDEVKATPASTPSVLVVHPVPEAKKEPRTHGCCIM